MWVAQEELKFYHQLISLVAVSLTQPKIKAKYRLSFYNFRGEMGKNYSKPLYFDSASFKAVTIYLDMEEVFWKVSKR